MSIDEVKTRAWSFVGEDFDSETIEAYCDALDDGFEPNAYQDMTDDALKMDIELFVDYYEFDDVEENG